ncbi:MAG: F-type H+-transporting ATPase subunit epsilon [Cyanobacteriota bacterium erpe_2018_sw_21hr_WHONDRS-SW48-000092_B_bin.40]|jgi:F-type H+-transporting ATPase subunit epsilon|nr:F-type H+-transporting ATPase subunit epsilon [Cyanobacteriota bacterium erpe_2018_sw_21hr_WHONDRS-SW48-000092_B_bin.40]
MQESDLITLKVLLPFGVFAEKADVLKVVADTNVGSVGILPHRLDCVAALTPGILFYKSESDGEVYIAVDQGILVKVGLTVLISVSNAIAGKDLDQLKQAVESQFFNLNQQEKNVRSLMAKLESGLISRLAGLQRD